MANALIVVDGQNGFINDFKRHIGARRLRDAGLGEGCLAAREATENPS